MAGAQCAPRDSRHFSKEEKYATKSQKYFCQNHRNMRFIIREIHMKISEKYISQDLGNAVLHLCVCVLLGPVNNGRWCCCELRAGGRWLPHCMEMWQQLSSQCPPLPPIVNTHRTVNPLTWAPPALGKREKTGNTQQVRNLTRKVLKMGQSGLILRKYGLKLER